jgi:hypothetical protein
MSFLYFIAGFIFCYFLIELGKKFVIKQVFVNMEKQFLLGAINLLQYKYHTIQLINIVYERAAEEDKKYIEEHKMVVNKLEERFNFFGDILIQNMQNSFPYNLEYKSWKEALDYANKLFNNDKLK